MKNTEKEKQVGAKGIYDRWNRDMNMLPVYGTPECDVILSVAPGALEGKRDDSDYEKAAGMILDHQKRSMKMTMLEARVQIDRAVEAVEAPISVTPQTRDIRCARKSVREWLHTKRPPNFGDEGFYELLKLANEGRWLEANALLVAHAFVNS